MFRNPKQRNSRGWAGAACLTSNHCCFPQCYHSSQLSRTSTSSSSRKKAQAARARWDRRSSQELLCLSCSLVHTEFLQPFPISSTPGKIGWVSSSSGFVLGRAAVLPLLRLRRGRWRELKGSSISSTHTAICYCEKPSVSRYYNPQRGNYS